MYGHFTEQVCPTGHGGSLVSDLQPMDEVLVDLFHSINECVVSGFWLAVNSVSHLLSFVMKIVLHMNCPPPTIMRVMVWLRQACAEQKSSLRNVSIFLLKNRKICKPVKGRASPQGWQDNNSMLSVGLLCPTFTSRCRSEYCVPNLKVKVKIQFPCRFFNGQDSWPKGTPDSIEH